MSYIIIVTLQLQQLKDYHNNSSLTKHYSKVETDSYIKSQIIGNYGYHMVVKHDFGLEKHARLSCTKFTVKNHELYNEQMWSL